MQRNRDNTADGMGKGFPHSLVAIGRREGRGGTVWVRGPLYLGISSETTWQILYGVSGALSETINLIWRKNSFKNNMTARLIYGLNRYI